MFNYLYAKLWLNDVIGKAHKSKKFAITNNFSLVDTNLVKYSKICNLGKMYGVGTKEEAISVLKFLCTYLV